MLSSWAYILIGNDKSGKTSFQKYLLRELCGQEYQRLPRNHVADITLSSMPRRVENLSAMNRSYQETLGDYHDVPNYFKSYFQEADVCILSSHANGNAINDVREMIYELKERGYNVSAVFFSNAYDHDAKKIAHLDWDHRLWLENPVSNEENQVQLQLEQLAHDFIEHLVAKAGLL